MDAKAESGTICDVWTFLNPFFAKHETGHRGRKDTDKNVKTCFNGIHVV